MSEFIRLFPVDKLHGGEMAQTISATAAELAALAARFAIPGIETLSAELIIRKDLLVAGRFEVEGQAQAKLLLTCGVSAEDYLHAVDAPIRAVFIDGFVPPHTEEMEIDYEWDDPEPLDNGSIDLGELVAQHIMLAVPAYPRRPDAGWDGPTDEDPTIVPVKTSPFAVLQSLKEHKP